MKLAYVLSAVLLAALFAGCTLKDDAAWERNASDLNALDSNYSGEISGSEKCASSWQCGNWTECHGGLRVRSCAIANGCQNITGMPSMEEMCGNESAAVPETLNSTEQCYGQGAVLVRGIVRERLKQYGEYTFIGLLFLENKEGVILRDNSARAPEAFYLTDNATKDAGYNLTEYVGKSVTVLGKYLPTYSFLGMSRGSEGYAPPGAGYGYPCCSGMQVLKAKFSTTNAILVFNIADGNVTGMASFPCVDFAKYFPPAQPASVNTWKSGLGCTWDDNAMCGLLMRRELAAANVTALKFDEWLFENLQLKNASESYQYDQYFGYLFGLSSDAG